MAQTTDGAMTLSNDPFETEQVNGSSIDPSSIPSPVLARLIEEVRNEEPTMIEGYNRFHNRHNR